MRAGAWAVQFGIGDNFSLNSFSGGAIAIKHRSSANQAWRAGMSLGVDGRGVDRHLEFPDTTTLQEEDFDRQSIGIELDRLHYFGSGPVVRAYFGYGPRAAWSHDDLTALDQRVMNESWSAGVGGAFGAEFRAASAIGVHAEYRYRFQYSWQRQERSSVSGIAPSERIEVTGWNLSSAGVRFGLSAYF